MNIDVHIIEDVHNFGYDYSLTLKGWLANFKRFWDDKTQAAYRPRLNESEEQFYRMWQYYLEACAAGFRVRYNLLWQFVFSKKGVPGGYICPR